MFSSPKAKAKPSASSNNPLASIRRPPKKQPRPPPDSDDSNDDDFIPSSFKFSSSAVRAGKGPQLTSPVWKYFKFRDGDMVACSICKKQMVYKRGTGTSTSSLRRHLINVHDLYDVLQAEQN